MISNSSIEDRINKNEAYIAKFFEIFSKNDKIRFHGVSLDRKALDSFMVRNNFKKRTVALLSHARNIQCLIQESDGDAKDVARSIYITTAEFRNYLLTEKGFYVTTRSISHFRAILDSIRYPFGKDHASKNMELLPITYDLSFCTVFHGYLTSILEAYEFFRGVFKKYKAPLSSNFIAIGKTTDESNFSQLHHYFQKFDERIRRILHLISQELDGYCRIAKQ
ncbi:hypothetical protein POMI540_3828 [Schizosaccharomyces pombe]